MDIKGADSDVLVIGELTDETAQSGVVTVDDETDSPLPKHAKRNNDGTVTLPLFKRVSLTWKKPGGTPSEDTYSEFTMHRLNGDDMTAIGDAPKGQGVMAAIARSAKIPFHLFKHIFKVMDGADIQAAGAVVAHFLANGPTTGASGSPV